MRWSGGDTPGTQPGQGIAAPSQRLRTNTTSFSDLSHLITSCDFLGTMHRNEQAAASGHNRITPRLQLPSPPHTLLEKSPSGVVLERVAHSRPSSGCRQRCPKSPRRSRPSTAASSLIYYLASPFSPHPATCSAARAEPGRGREAEIKAEMQKEALAWQ